MKTFPPGPAERTPETYCINPNELHWLVAEAPRFEMLFGDDGIRLGFATIEEIAALLYPNTAITYKIDFRGGATVREYIEALFRDARIGGAIDLRNGQAQAAKYDDHEERRPPYLIRWGQ